MNLRKLIYLVLCLSINGLYPSQLNPIRIFNPYEIICSLLNKINPLHIIPQDILYWNWEAIDINQSGFLETLSFPKNFKWGVADSAYQVEGPYYYDDKIAENNWTEWEKGNYEDGKLHIARGDKIGRACDRWNRYKDDIKLMAECGFTMYRFSIEWSKIEPEPGVFDEKAMQHYSDVVDELKKYGIEPVACLFHQTWPLWFDGLGEWQHKRNIRYFVDYAKYVFEHLHDKVTLWMTVNEPVGFAMGGYYVGDIPSGKKDLTLCGKVVANLLEAHCACYKVFKDINKNAQIGFCHVINHIDPYHRFNPVEKIGAFIFDHLVNDVAIEYFLTGKFEWGYPWKTLISRSNKDALQCLDWIGVNYYAHTNICMDIKKILNIKEFVTPQPRKDKREIQINETQALYPEGLYRAIVRCTRLNKPMHITEIGVADNDDSRKKDFFRKHLYAASEAIKAGYDVRSCTFWTLMDNWEWSKGYEMKFGLYEVNFETQERTLRKGAEELLAFVQSKKKKQ